MKAVRHVFKGCFVLLLSTAARAQSANLSTTLVSPSGDGTTDDTGAVQTALNGAAGTCATVKLQCTRANTFKVSSTVKVPKCVKLVGECGGVPDEGSETSVGTTLRWPVPLLVPSWRFMIPQAHR
jgi:hypothetical protein